MNDLMQVLFHPVNVPMSNIPMYALAYVFCAYSYPGIAVIAKTLGETMGMLIMLGESGMAPDAYMRKLTQHFMDTYNRLERKTKMQARSYLVQCVMRLATLVLPLILWPLFAGVLQIPVIPAGMVPAACVYLPFSLLAVWMIHAPALRLEDGDA